MAASSQNDDGQQRRTDLEFVRGWSPTISTTPISKRLSESGIDQTLAYDPKLRLAAEAIRDLACHPFVMGLVADRVDLWLEIFP